MFFPKLIDLITDNRFSDYSRELITIVDDYLGTLKAGTVFNESDLNLSINNLLLTDKVLADLSKLDLIEEWKEEDEIIEISEGEILENKKFVLLEEPNKMEDKNYLEYLNNKRKIDSFSIIYERTKQKNSGALALIDLKGYSKNINNKETNALVLRLTEKLQNTIDEAINPFFLNKYSGIEIKHNGDGWFFYFLNENDAYEFLDDVLSRVINNDLMKNNFKALQTSLKCYLHHAKEIEKIYKVDTLHFDMEGKDVILIHMLEKPIEKALYGGLIKKDHSFLAVTEAVLNRIKEEYASSLIELKNLKIDITDSEGNLKVAEPDVRIFYKEIGF